MNTKVITTHVAIVLTKRIDGIANTLQRSRGWIMTQALSEWGGPVGWHTDG